MTCPICQDDGWYASGSFADPDKQLIHIRRVPCECPAGIIYRQERPPKVSTDKRLN